jgi:Tol biopolymer transport system component
MRVSAHGFAATLIALAAALSTGCGGESPISPPVTGTLVVSVVTQGSAANWDSDGYTVKLDDNVPQIVGGTVNLILRDLAIGNHVVVLGGLSSNCTLTGPASRAVEVGEWPAMISFEVVCVQPTGTVRVSTTTSGTDPDVDGYSVLFGGTIQAEAPVNGTVDIVMAEGGHGIQLGGVAGNCAVDAPNPRTVVVATGAVVQVGFVIQCTPSAKLNVTVTTGGVSLDANGYSVRVSEEGRLVTADDVPANGSVVISGLGTATYVVSLYEIAANCDVTTSNRRTVALVAGSAPTELAIDLTCGVPRQLAYVSAHNSGDIHLINSIGVGNIRLTDNSASDVDPAWSADGSRIAFTSSRDGNAEIYVMDASGENQVRVTNSPDFDHSPTWSPDGSRIAFVSVGDGNTEIFVVNADGTNRVRLTTQIGADTDPAWSPDGTKIAFRSDRTGSAVIWLMNADGSSPSQLTSGPLGDLQPAWSPDGTRIAFSGTVGSFTRDIFIVNADGSGRTRITNGYEDAEQPSWSPDGRKIAFTAFSYYYQSDIVVISTEGIEYAPIATPNFPGVNPSWRP